MADLQAVLEAHQKLLAMERQVHDWLDHLLHDKI